MNIAEILITGGMLTANTVRDIRRREILLWPTLLVLAAGVIRSLIAGNMLSDPGGLHWVLALLPGAVLLLLSITAEGKLGTGDGLAVCAAGIWCGVESILLTLFFSLLLLPVFVGLMHLRRRPVSEVPFLPFLLAGYLIAELLLREG